MMNFAVRLLKCRKCLYRQGLVKSIISPCIKCRIAGQKGFPFTELNIKKKEGK